MELQVAPIYLQDADCVEVEVQGLNDAGVPTIPDNITLSLFAVTTTLVGATTRTFLTSLSVDSSYGTPSQNYICRFHKPRFNKSLQLDCVANFGSIQITRANIVVGQSVSPDTTLELPDNFLSGINNLLSEDYTLMPPDASSGEPAPDRRKNHVVLSPPLRTYVTPYNFAQPDPDLLPLPYAGGGNRLLMNQDGTFVLQGIDMAPWDLDCFTFLEPAVENLIPNSFLLQGSGPPTGFSVDGAGALVTQTLQANPKVAQGVNLWAVRFRQNAFGSGFNTGSLVIDPVLLPVAETTYCFSSYVKVTQKVAGTQVTQLNLVMSWFEGDGMISTQQETFSPADLTGLQLCSVQGLAPPHADNVRLSIGIASIDPGDDVEVSILTPQLELGQVATSRCQGDRAADTLTFPSVPTVNQKIRFQLSMGFPAGIPQSFCTGAFEADFTEAGTLHVSIPHAGVELETPVLTFQPGDELDFVIQTQSNGLLELLISGEPVASTELPEFQDQPQDLVLTGCGAELLQAWVFNRI